MLVRRDITRLARAACSGNSTVNVMAFLLRRTPNFTVRSFFIALARKLFTELADGTNALAIQRSDDVARLTPAFSAGEPESTSRTSIPSPSGAPKNAPS